MFQIEIFMSVRSAASGIFLKQLNVIVKLLPVAEIADTKN